MAEPYYITTAISYPNGKPHIGHAYEAIATDAIARFQRLDGYDVLFVTGTDEHGIKMLQTAAKEKLTPPQLVERMADAARTVGVLVAVARFVALCLHDLDTLQVGFQFVGDDHRDRRGRRGRDGPRARADRSDHSTLNKHLQFLFRSQIIQNVLPNLLCFYASWSKATSLQDNR